MMTKITVLILLFLAGWWGVNDYIDTRASLVAATATINKQHKTIKQYKEERVLRDELQVAQSQFNEALRVDRDTALGLLESAKYENEALRDHLRKRVPDVIVAGLRIRAGQRNPDRTTGTTQPIPATTQAAEAIVTNDRLYQWCGDVVEVARSCEQDKDSIRKWVEGKKQNSPGTD
ncbi:MAG: hypothetical protein HUJ30_00900 [Gammaproteobacteria bacterium]|nr:hypothetical protein [Gammaproteobacteria bacterium]